MSYVTDQIKYILHIYYVLTDLHVQIVIQTIASEYCFGATHKNIQS